MCRCIAVFDFVVFPRKTFLGLFFDKSAVIHLYPGSPGKSITKKRTKNSVDGTECQHNTHISTVKERKQMSTLFT